MPMRLVDLIDRRFRSIVSVLIVLGMALGGGAWAVVGAVGRFTELVDQRALKVVEIFTARPLIEQEEMKRTLAAQQKLIDTVVESQRQMDHNLTKLLTVYEEERRTIPVRLAKP